MMEWRKALRRSGPGSYVLGIPKDWLKLKGLQGGGVVVMEDRPEGLLIKPEKQEVKVTKPAPPLSPSTIDFTEEDE